jgi:hypothetical protein
MPSPVSLHPADGPAALLRDALRQTPSWLISMVLHAILMLAMALWVLDPQVQEGLRQIVATPPPEDVETPEDVVERPNPEVEIESTPTLQGDPEIDKLPIDPAGPPETVPVVASADPDNFGPVRIPDGVLRLPPGGPPGHGDYRKPGKIIGTEETPAARNAIGPALKWLADHQLSDGGWSFDLNRVASCGGQCRDSGSMNEARVAATALALLPFLGFGETHKEGKYKQTIARGLYFLTNHAKVSPQGCALNESGGRMYSHGLASIVLTEAYGMTRDKQLYVPAQGAINFICYAQDPNGGGWRYEPRQPGDTSVVGWQVMALKSGHIAYLRVPPQTTKKAFEFLDSVQVESGAAYGYVGPNKGDATTAIGLLCRMYLGWKKDNPALQRGVRFLSERGPSEGNMYYNYYATQVLFHWGGDEWKKWNATMRDQLVRSQAKQGHEAGSWFMGKGGDHGASSGGRLYCTAMAAMTLEVYYRLMPMYQKDSVEADFPE